MNSSKYIVKSEYSNNILFIKFKELADDQYYLINYFEFNIIK